MKTIKLLLAPLMLLLFFSGCNDHDDNYYGYYNERAFNVVNMKVGSDTAMLLYLEADYYPVIDGRYGYGEAIDYYLNLSYQPYSEIFLETYYEETKLTGFLDDSDQTMVIFGADTNTNDSLYIPTQVRTLYNEFANYSDAATINLINALPTQEFSNVLPYLGFESTLFLEVNGYRVSNNISYMENDRFVMDGVDYSNEYITLTLVLSDGSAIMFDMHLRNGHSYNLIVGHLHNSLYSEPTIYMYDVTY